jgi:hypothetical protein
MNLCENIDGQHETTLNYVIFNKKKIKFKEILLYLVATIFQVS